MVEVVKEPRRGDIFWVKDSVSAGSEEGFKRPGVIVSSDAGNTSANPTVIVASCTTSSKFGKINVPVMATGRKTFVMCNQIFTADRSRLCGYMGTLSDKEMLEVDRTLGIAMAIREDSDGDESWDDEKRELLEEIDSLKSQLADRKNSEAKDTMQTDLWRRLYEKALDELVSVRIALDLSERMNKPEPRVEKAVEAPKVAVHKSEEPEPRVEINTCTEAELRSVGCSAEVAVYIVRNRPYKSVEDLKRIPQLTRMAYQILESKICCVPPKKEEKPKFAEVRKVNVNTATVDEMQAVGLPLKLAQHIRAYRNKHGLFATLEDLLNVDLFGKTCMKRYGDRLEV